MLKVHNIKYIRVCPDCKDISVVGYKHQSYVRKTGKLGKCLKCANQKTTPTSFKKGHKTWNKGMGASKTRLEDLKEWGIWRTHVFRRDGYKCIECGKEGGELHPDHIYPKSLFPEMAFSVPNGRTLCAECHRNTDTYGYRVKKWTPSSFMDDRQKNVDAYMNDLEWQLTLHIEQHQHD